MDENQKFIEKCFLNLVEMGEITNDDFKPSTITDEELDDLQKKYNIVFPQFYRDLLQTYYFNFSRLLGVVDDWLIGYNEQYIFITPNIDDGLKNLCKYWDDCEEAYHFIENGYLPIGDWGGAGPLCIDTRGDSRSIQYDNKKTWTLVWFDHEEFFEAKEYADFKKAERPAAPDLRELMEWYFLGKYDDEYEDYEEDDEEDDE